ncbi:MAG TPA: HypC/HybG/HupF family hydrogenase formation chaperone [Solirubrobacteraceae bacterium]|nr:HypC/HybG/HupF family hydrogenase formation chaperone [Solirubrobacteraceae bacterium]
MQSCRSDDEVVAEHCITCGDVAVEMIVLRVDEARGLALCEAEDGARETVEIGLVDPVRPADRLLIHAGTALAHQGGSL